MLTDPDKVQRLEDSLSSTEDGLQRLQSKVRRFPSSVRTELLQDLELLRKSVEKSRMILFSEDTTNDSLPAVGTPVQETLPHDVEEDAIAAHDMRTFGEVNVTPLGLPVNSGAGYGMQAASSPRTQPRSSTKTVPWNDIFTVVSQHAGRDWRQLFRTLNKNSDFLKTESMIQEITHKHQLSLSEQVLESLHYIYRNHPHFSVAMLIEGLRKCRMNLTADTVIDMLG